MVQMISSFFTSIPIFFFFSFCLTFTFFRLSSMPPQQTVKEDSRKRINVKTKWDSRLISWFGEFELTLNVYIPMLCF